MQFVKFLFISTLVVIGVEAAEDDVQVRVRFPEESGRTRRFEPFDNWHHHHHHHHHHEESRPMVDLRFSGGNLTEIPIDFVENMSRYSDLQDILENFVEGIDNGPTLQTRFDGPDNTARDGALRPKPAECMPELTSVEIATTDEPTIMFLPCCTRIERCGGCCRHPKLECRPTQTETVNFLVYKTQYTGDSKLKYVSKDVVLVDRHVKCKCGCKLQAEDCVSRYQTYNEDTCSCTCTNRDEEAKCLRNKETKLWNPDLCVCQCREEKRCSSGYYFDNINECKCVQTPMRKRFAARNRYRINDYDYVIALP